MKRHVNGFTLMELMITVAIVVILAAVAIPNYSDYVKKSRRNEAIHGLNATRNALEKFRLSQNAYPDSIATLDTVVTSHGLSLSGTDWVTENGYYRIEIWTDLGGNPNSIVAFPLGSQSNDEQCQRFSLFLDGSRTSSDSNGVINTGSCWPN